MDIPPCRISKLLLILPNLRVGAKMLYTHPHPLPLIDITYIKTSIISRVNDYKLHVFHFSLRCITLTKSDTVSI